MKHNDEERYDNVSVPFKMTNESYLS